MTFTVF